MVTETVICLVSDSELAWFLVYTLMVTETVICLVSASELAWFLMCTLLLTQTVTCLVSEGKLALVFTVLFSGDTDCGLSCIRE